MTLAVDPSESEGLVEVVSNMSKPLTVLMSFFLFQAETSMDALTGLMMVLLSGALYSFTTQKR